MFKFLRSIFVCIILVALIFSSVSYAKKPVKLSNKYMAQTHGAIVPLVVGAAVGAYAIACAVDEVAGQYDYFTKDPNGIALAKKWEEHTVTSNAKAASNPTMLGLGSLGIAVQQAISAYDFYTQNQMAINQWGRYTGDKNIKIITDPKNVIAGAAGGVGEAAGMAFKGATGAVQLGAEGIDAAKPFVFGAGTELAKTTGQLLIEAPGNCLVDNNYTLTNKTAACIQDKVIDKATDPLTWLSVVGAGMGRGESYNSRNGDPNPDAYNGISNLNKGTGVLSNGQDIIDQLGDNQDQKMCVAPQSSNSTPSKSTTNNDRYQCVAPAHTKKTASTTDSNHYQCIAPTTLNNTANTTNSNQYQCVAPTTSNNTVNTTNSNQYQCVAPTNTSSTRATTSNSNNSSSSSSSSHSSSQSSSTASSRSSSPSTSSNTVSQASSSNISEAHSVAVSATPTNNLGNASATTRAAMSSRN